MTFYWFPFYEVLHKGKLWRAKVDIYAQDYTGIDSTRVGADSALARIDTTMEDWERMELLMKMIF